jgi:alkylated DNA repair dioxygenase AlkB
VTGLDETLELQQRQRHIIMTPQSCENDEDGLWDPPAATILAPEIPGLHFDPNVLLDQSYANELARNALPYFQGGSNQVMLFGRAASPDSELPGGLPIFISELITHLTNLLRDRLPPSTHQLLFPSLPSEHIYPARQVILNLYRPGEGITPHVDLLQRFGDGIVGVSLLSGTVMSLTPASSPELRDDEESPQATRHQIYLPARSIIVLEKEARYQWKHGIPARKLDFVETGALGGLWRDRHTRISITIRWLLPGAEVVGGDAPQCEEASR